MPMLPMVRITEEPSPDLAAYASVPSRFEVREVLALAAQPGLDGLPLAVRPVDDPYVKDYDAIPGHHPTDWGASFDVRGWGVLGAWRGTERVGGAVVAWDTPGLHLAGGRDDLAVLWDLRVAPGAQRQGVGAALFRAAEAWAVARGAAGLLVETQNVNVPACRFYARQGCTLAAIHRFAYPGLPHEVQLLWLRELPG